MFENFADFHAAESLGGFLHWNYCWVGHGHWYALYGYLIGLPQQGPGQCWPHCLGAMSGFWCIRRQLFPDCVNRLVFSRWDSWFGAAGLDHASDFATHLLTVCFTVCVGWRSTFPLSPSFVVVLNVSQLTAASRFLVSLRWCVCPFRVLRTSWWLFNYHCHRHAAERSRRVPWASVAPSCH